MNPKKSVKVVRTVKPGKPGTHKWVRRYGDLLVAVRYRYNAPRRARFTTVEVIVDERPWLPGMDLRHELYLVEPPVRVLVRVNFQETQLRQKVRQAGGRWDATEKAWELPMETVKQMGLEERVVFKSRPRDAPL